MDGTESGPGESAAPDAGAAEVLAQIGSARRGRWVWWLALALMLAAIGGGVALVLGRGDAGDTREYVTRAVTRGTLTATVTATGSLRGRDTVDVGAEISGRLKTVAVDFNDRVEEGQLLAEIDPEQHRANRDQARAQLIAANAELKNRRATLDEARLQTQRTERMAKDGLASEQQVETARAALLRAEAAKESAEAQVVVATASLSSAETALSRTKIRSPITGIVLSRAVEPGQAVVAAMQSPVLFTLARDLTQMELTVAIDEADIGRVQPGQPATFTVDAYPDRTFPTTLEATHNVAVTKDNIVTYEAELSVENPERLLRPGMTATVTIVTSTREGVLLVPNMALRFKPPNDVRRLALPGMPRPRGPGPDQDGRPTVWVLREGAPTAVRITTGMTDGEHTEVTGDGLSASDEVIVDLLERKAKR